MLFLAAFLAAAFAQPQTQVSVPVDKKTVIRPSLGLTFELPSLSFYLRDQSGKDIAQFKPNETMRVGLEAAYDGYKAAFSLPMPADENSVREKGRTDHFDLHLGHYWEQLGADFFYQKYHGFYLDSPATDSDQKTFSQRRDLNSDIYGANFYYSLAPERFALQNLQQFHEQTNVRGGSWVAFLGLNELRLRGESPLVSTLAWNQARIRSASAGAGYAYHYPIRSAHMLNGFMLIGAGPQWQELTSRTQTKAHTRLGQQVVINGSYVYKWDLWQAGFLLKYNSVQADLGSSHQLAAESFTVKFFAVRSL